MWTTSNWIVETIVWVTLVRRPVDPDGVAPHVLVEEYSGE
jgi:hypothetical protein